MFNNNNNKNNKNIEWNTKEKNELSMKIADLRPFSLLYNGSGDF